MAREILPGLSSSEVVWDLGSRCNKLRELLDESDDTSEKGRKQPVEDRQGNETADVYNPQVVLGFVLLFNPSP